MGPGVGPASPDRPRPSSCLHPPLRRTAYEAARFGVTMPEEIPMVGQERAYTSPIWYSPGG